jgi:hypothetical protein
MSNCFWLIKTPTSKQTMKLLMMSGMASLVSSLLGGSGKSRLWAM